MNKSIELPEGTRALVDLQGLIEWHKLNKVKQCYYNYIKANYPIYDETSNIKHEIRNMNSFEISKEIFDEVIKDESLSEPAIETKLVKFMEEWYE